MASDDVIELGSSDDEPEPAPKKRKPMPNAMVHIPLNLPVRTSKQEKTNMGYIQKKLIGKPVTLTKLGSLTVNPLISIKQNGKPVQTSKSNFQNPLTKPILIQNRAINTAHLMNKLGNNQLKRNRVASKLPQNNISKFQGVPFNKLPSGITIKPTIGRLNPLAVKNMPIVIKKNLVVKRKPVEVMTLDDDEPAGSSTTGPQWYMRPEDEKQLEEENYKEPDTKNLIEITIDDSPIKPTKNRRTCEIGSELAITIEDSPVKAIENDDNTECSDGEKISEIQEKVPHSKKRLEYPKDNEENKVIEVEIESVKQNNELDSSTNENLGGVDKNTLEIIDSPVKTVKKEDIKEEISETQLTSNSSGSNEIATCSETGEFHPVYQSFIDLCFKLENSNDMKTIVEKKIKQYYRQVPKEYTTSEEFIDLVSSKIYAMKAGPEKMYLYIKDIVDELNLQRKLVKSQVRNDDNKGSDKFSYGDDIDMDNTRQRQIHKLEKTLKKLHRAIQKLEEQEVDFDDDEDSVYLLTERYKERMVRVHAKFCQLTNTKMPSEPHIVIEARPGQPAGPAKRLEKYVNKKVPIGTPLPFPDFHDVLRCVKEANEEDELGWNDADIMEEARDLFTRCGRKLQRRRQENEWRLAASRISFEVDPAENNAELSKKLDDNKKIAAKKEIEVLNKYADRQNILKLEAVEIGDKEAEESPVESEDEVNEDMTSLETKEKRKQRLRRLIKEKSRKSTTDEAVSQEINTIQESTEKSNHVKDVDKKGSEKIQNISMEVDPDIRNQDIDMKDVKNNDNIQSLSDDSNKVDSDVDELHLLQKLHSDEINSSAVDSTDSESPIAISDTLGSSSDNDEANNVESGVISIENSSYSESEALKDGDDSQEEHITKVSSECIDLNIKEDITVPSNKNDTDCNSYKDDDIAENILLASSDEELSGNNIVCATLNDDELSIGETIISEPQQQTIMEENNHNTVNKNQTEHENDVVFASDKQISNSKDSVNLVNQNFPNVDEFLMIEKAVTEASASCPDSIEVNLNNNTSTLNQKVINSQSNVNVDVEMSDVNAKSMETSKGKATHNEINSVALDEKTLITANNENSLKSQD